MTPGPTDEAPSRVRDAPLPRPPAAPPGRVDTPVRGFERRLEDVTSTIQEFAALRFEARALIGPDGDIVDSVAIRGAKTIATMPSGRSHIRNFGCVMTPESWSIGSSVVARTVRSLSASVVQAFLSWTVLHGSATRYLRVDRDASRSLSRPDGLEPGSF